MPQFTHPAASAPGGSDGEQDCRNRCTQEGSDGGSYGSRYAGCKAGATAVFDHAHRVAPPLDMAHNRISLQLPRESPANRAEADIRTISSALRGISEYGFPSCNDICAVWVLANVMGILSKGIQENLGRTGMEYPVSYPGHGWTLLCIG